MPETKISEADAGEPKSKRQRANSRRTPDIEVAIGARLRAARIGAQMSQSNLGAAAGISFQQVQKYESGKDRIAASTLQAFSTLLGVHPGSFFEDIPAPIGTTLDVRIAMRVGEIAQRIRNPALHRRLIALMEELAASEERAKAEHGPTNGSGPH